MFIIIGTKLFAWGSALTPQPYHCNACGAQTPFIEKTAMRFLTLFFFIPVIPISGKKLLVECPRCKTRYER
jgi:hypothetical protein